MVKEVQTAWYYQQNACPGPLACKNLPKQGRGESWVSYCVNTISLQTFAGEGKNHFIVKNIRQFH